jgi:hypothetical protein
MVVVVVVGVVVVVVVAVVVVVVGLPCGFISNAPSTSTVAGMDITSTTTTTAGLLEC